MKLLHQNVELTPVNNCAKFHLICINSKKVTVGGGEGRNQPQPEMEKPFVIAILIFGKKIVFQLLCHSLS